MEPLYFEYGRTETDYLARKDKKLGALIDRVGIIKRSVSPDLFSALVDSIISQQISSKAADTICGRLLEITEIEPEKIAGLETEVIQKCGVSMKKAGYIKGIAEAALDGRLELETIPAMSDEEVIKSLVALKGVGVWTAEMLLIFSLQRKNILSYGDLAIRRGIMNLYGHKELSVERFEKYKKRYSPYGSVASLYLWELAGSPDVLHIKK